MQTPEGATRLTAGDYGLLPVGMPHEWRNDDAAATARWAQMRAPQPGPRCGHDVFDVVLLIPDRTRSGCDVRDPRNRYFGHIEPVNMEVDKQRQELLAMSASMRTALLVCSGITVKMMVDSDLGAELTTMFMVQYQPAGSPASHDHPFEETYLFLEGEADAVFDGQTYRLRAGDARVRRRRLRARLHQRRRRSRALAGDSGTAAAGPTLVPVRARLGLPALGDATVQRGGTLRWPVRLSSSAARPGSAGTLANRYAGRGRSVVLTGRDATTAAKVASEVGASGPGPRARPLEAAGDRRQASPAIGPGRPPRPRRDRPRCQQRATVRHRGGASIWVTLKLVGYTEVVHALADRLTGAGVDPARLEAWLRERPVPRLDHS